MKLGKIVAIGVGGCLLMAGCGKKTEPTLTPNDTKPAVETPSETSTPKDPATTPDISTEAESVEDTKKTGLSFGDLYKEWGKEIVRMDRMVHVMEYVDDNDKIIYSEGVYEKDEDANLVLLSNAKFDLVEGATLSNPQIEWKGYGKGDEEVAIFKFDQEAQMLSMEFPNGALEVFKTEGLTFPDELLVARNSTVQKNVKEWDGYDEWMKTQAEQEQK